MKFLQSNKVTVFLIAILFLLAVAAGQAIAAPPREDPPPGLFIDAGAAQPGDVQTLGRSRLVKIDLAQFGGEGADGSGLGLANPNPTLRLNLFEDVILTAALDRVEPNPSGGYIWVGHIPGVELSQILLVVKDGLMVGDIRSPGAVYEVQPADNGLHLVRQPDPAASANLGNDVVLAPQMHSLSNPLLNPAEFGPLADNGSVIDLMVVYTPLARSRAGSVAAIGLKIDTGVAQTNNALLVSSINNLRLRLVYKGEISYTESGNTQTDLQRLYNSGDGFMDEIHYQRNLYRADLVALITGAGSISYCDGYAQMPPSDGFSVTQLDCLTNLTFTHEIGHNLGAGHDWYVDDNDSYAKGYVNVAGRWRTIMAYDNLCQALGTHCVQVSLFSNPGNLFNGAPMGVPAGTNQSCTAGNKNNPPCDADNHRSIIEWANWVANNRFLPLPPALTAGVTTVPFPVLPTTTQIQFVITLRNSGEYNTTGVQLVNTIPAGLTYVSGSASNGGTYAGGKITWSNLSIAAGSSINLTLRANVPVGFLHNGDQLINIIQATSTQGATIPSTQLLTVVGPKFTYLPLVITSPGGALPACTPVTPTESNNVADAPTICSGQSVTGQVSRPADLGDVYKIWVKAEQRAAITLSGSGGDVDLYLFPPETTDVTINPIAAASAYDGNTEAIYAPLSVSGFWYIDVYAYNGTTNYTLKVTITP